MQLIFNNINPIGQNALRPVYWPYAEAGLIRNLEQVQTYYKSKPFAVKSQHILVKLLNNIGVSYNLSLDRFHSIISAHSLNLSMVFKMTSSLYTGNIFRGIFYGEGTSEILMAIDDTFDPYEVKKNWMNTKAVKVLSHPNSDLGFLLPNGKKQGFESGLAVISINISMLAVQFKCFLENEMQKSLSNGGDRLTAAHFVHMYVLPNMLDSQLDMCLFNRAYNLLVGAPMGEPKMKHPFYLTDYSKQIDISYKEILNYFKSTNRTYSVILKSFLTIAEDNFESLLRLPDNAPTRQVVWAEFVSRLKAIEFLLKINTQNGEMNKSTNNTISRFIKFYESDKIIPSVLPKDVYYDIQSQIRDIKKLLN